ncbi:uncharacterized protein SCHCODRAFT_02223741 [Schizophyllum commune H4-8]|uniref:uncharacterized protein n=1 Tax=Schizophyllum commune (strain H4-8 / FGSC 9210) TaxID=578458 RepID=UPI00215FB0D1|nr:uncharacterized protein SCHCODRAFT_02223741 [Schizophyllum commune H4-8]KAI5895107.1 hypothetical protein SCHCODRAFT_02223741 [Schizophyllum commune H4-8]
MREEALLAPQPSTPPVNLRLPLLHPHNLEVSCPRSHKCTSIPRSSAPSCHPPFSPPGIYPPFSYTHTQKHTRPSSFVDLYFASARIPAYIMSSGCGPIGRSRRAFRALGVLPSYRMSLRTCWAHLRSYRGRLCIYRGHLRTIGSPRVPRHVSDVRCGPFGRTLRTINIVFIAVKATILLRRL